MNFQNIKQELGLDGQVSTDKSVLDKYSKDASIFAVRPQCVVAVEGAADIRKLVKYVNENKSINPNLSLTARAAGTCMSGGSLSESIILSFTENMNKVLEVGDDYAVTQMGVYYRDFEKETLKKGMYLPSYPASRDLCAIGGMVNNNAAGEKTLRYRTTERYIQEIEMVCADGNVYNFKEESSEEWKRVCSEDRALYGDIHRGVDKILKENKKEIQENKPSVSKNASGYYLWNVYDESKNTYNLAKLICGAQGTLGMVTKARLGLVKEEKYSRMFVVFIKDVKSIPSIVSRVMPMVPDSFELYDDHTFKIAMRFWFDIVKKIGGNIFVMGFQFLPEFLMVLFGGVPKVILLAEFTGSSEEDLEQKIKSNYQKMKDNFKEDKSIKMHLVGKNEMKKYWTFRRESFNLLRSKLKGLRTAPFIEDVVIHKDDFPTFFPRFERLLDEYKLVYTIAGHVGDGHLHVIPLMKLAQNENIETIKELSEKVYTLVKEYKGSISGEHNDGLVRTPFLNYMFTDKMLSLFQEVKDVFDPKNIFNPNKKVGGSWEESIKKIDRSV
jgi:FAD/FMN-containing dehydrogenase